MQQQVAGALTTDLWTSVQNMSYMVITTHFIDSDWCLNGRIISFSVIKNHRGKLIGKKIVACLQDWGIERFAITVVMPLQMILLLVMSLCSCLLGGMMMHLCWRDNICMCIVVHIF